MKRNKQFKKGSTAPGALLIFVILIVLVIAIFFIASYLSNFVPNRLNEQNSATSTPSGDENNAEEIQIETLSQGVYSSYKESGGLIIENESNLKTLWSQSVGGQAPTIDFTKEVVLAVFAGDKPTSGYSIKINKVAKVSNNLEASVTLVTPGKNCVVTGSITNPYHIVKIPKQELPIEFVSYDEVNDCK